MSNALAERFPELQGLKHLPNYDDFPEAENIFGTEDISGLNPNKLTELRILQILAWPHVRDDPSGKLALLALNPSEFPAQQKYHITSKTALHNPTIIEDVGKLANPKFPELLSGFEESVAGTERLQFAGELLKGGKNLVILTNHGELTDIALEEANYVIGLMKQYGTNFFKDLKRAIIISRIVSFVGVNLEAKGSSKPLNEQSITPAVDALGLLCDETFLSYPRTSSIESNVANALILVHNRGMLEQLRLLMRRGGAVVGVAGSGEKDKPIKSVPGAELEAVSGIKPVRRPLRMAKLRSGTVKIITHPNNYSAPTAVWMKDPVTSMMCDMPRRLATAEDAHKSMRLIAARLNEVVDGYSFVYGNDASPAAEDGAVE